MTSTARIAAILVLAGCGTAAEVNQTPADQPVRPSPARCRTFARNAAALARPETCAAVSPLWIKITGPNDPGETDWWSYPGSSNVSYGVGLASPFQAPNPGAPGHYPDADQTGPCYLSWRPGYSDAVRYDGLHAAAPPVAVFTWNGSAWEQQTGLIEREAAVVQRSVFLTNVGGLSFSATFTGGTTTSFNGQASVQDAIFYTSQRCFTGGTEFGFFRQIDGGPSDNLLFFYWGLNMNCPDLSEQTWYCALSTDGGQTYADVKTQTRYGIFEIPIPSLGQPWRYSVWLSGGPGAYVWNLRVTDPSGTTVMPCDTNGRTVECTMLATPGGITDPFNEFAASMLQTAANRALGGYIVLGSLNMLTATYYVGSDPPSMVVGDVWAPAY